MNLLTAEMKRSLRELDLGLKGELTITSDMEDLSNSLFFDQVNIFLYSSFSTVCLWFSWGMSCIATVAEKFYLACCVYCNMGLFHTTFKDVRNKIIICPAGSPSLDKAGLCLPERTVCLVCRPPAENQGAGILDFWLQSALLCLVAWLL